VNISAMAFKVDFYTVTSLILLHLIKTNILKVANFMHVFQCYITDKTFLLHL